MEEKIKINAELGKTDVSGRFFMSGVKLSIAGSM